MSTGHLVEIALPTGRQAQCGGLENIITNYD